MSDDTLEPVLLDLCGAAIQAAELERRLRILARDGGTGSKGSVLLDGATVVGDLDLSGLTFPYAIRCRDATFTGRAGFGRSQFAAVELAGSRFVGPASFAKAEFVGAVDGMGVEFLDAAVLTGARFAAGATFRRARFAGAARFRAVTFDQEGSFDEAVFDGIADFSGTTWSPPAVADFTGARFEGPFRLDGAKAQTSAEFKGAVGVEGPSGAQGPFERPSRRDFAVAPRTRAVGETEATSDEAGATLSWDAAAQAVQLLGAIAALVAWVVLIGGAVVYARLSAAHAPNPIRTVTLLPRDALLAQGIHTLALALLISTCLAITVYLSLAVPTVNRLAGAVSRRSVARAHELRRDFYARRGFLVIGFSILLVLWVELGTAFLLALGAFLLAAVIVWLAFLAMRDARSAIAAAAIVFATAMAVSGIIGYVNARWVSDPKFETVSVLLKDGRTLAGLLVGRTETRIGVLCGGPESRRVGIVAADDAEYVAVGVSRSLKEKDTARCDEEPAIDDRPPDDRLGDPVRSDEGQDGAQTVRVKVDRLRVDPVRVDPVKVDPVKVDRLKVDPVTVAGGRDVKVVRVPEVRETTRDRLRVVTVPGGSVLGQAPGVWPPSGGAPSRHPMTADRHGFYLFGTHPFTAPVSGVVQLVTAKAVGARPVRLGTKAFRSSGAGVLVRFRLSPRMRSELRRRRGHGIAVHVRLTVRGTNGVEATRTYAEERVTMP